MIKFKYIIAIFILAGIFAIGNYYHQKDALTERQEIIHQRGSLVMPFDLDKTTHSFTTTDEGGIQEVRAKNPNDQEQIAFIREHINVEAERFSQGDFGDPKTLHGESMPGLNILSESQGMYTVAYEKLSDGARLTYKTNDPEIANAFHLWFMAQMTDHGEDANL